MTTAAAKTRSVQAVPVVPGMRVRRSVPRILGGVLMALVGMAVFGVVQLRSSPAVEVLTVARPVQAGAVIAAADLATVSILADPTLRTVLARDRAKVVGRSTALPLAAGTLLTEAMLADAAAWPPSGQSVIAVGVKTGRAPSGLSPGAKVLVVVIPPNSATADQPSAPQATGTVIAVEQTDTSGLTVVTVQLNAEAAVRIASSTGDISIVLQGR
jgi:hypothetical protein